MKEKIKYFIAGIFIGLSELLPGISGATVALMFDVYEKLLDFLRKFNNLNLILPLVPVSYTHLTLPTIYSV